MTAFILDEVRLPYIHSQTVSNNLYIGGGAVNSHPLTPIHPGPSRFEIMTPSGPEYYRYEQYQAGTLWGLRKMSRMERIRWRLKKGQS